MKELPIADYLDRERNHEKGESWINNRQAVIGNLKLEKDT